MTQGVTTSLCHYIPFNFKNSIMFCMVCMFGQRDERVLPVSRLRAPACQHATLHYLVVLWACLCRLGLSAYWTHNGSPSEPSCSWWTLSKALDKGMESPVATVCFNLVKPNRSMSFKTWWRTVTQESIDVMYSEKLNGLIGLVDSLLSGTCVHWIKKIIHWRLKVTFVVAWWLRWCLWVNLQNLHILFFGGMQISKKHHDWELYASLD